jgi:hypothetical protein
MTSRNLFFERYFQHFQKYPKASKEAQDFTNWCKDGVISSLKAWKALCIRVVGGLKILVSAVQVRLLASKLIKQKAPVISGLGLF